MAEAFYEPTPATDGASMNPVPGAVFQVFELSDTGFTTPLSLRVGSGNPTTSVVASESLATLPGVYVTSPNFEHHWKSGSFVWRRDSIDGAKKSVEQSASLALSAANAAADVQLLAESGAFKGEPGPEGPRGLPGPNAVANDVAFAAAVSTSGTETNTALSATYESSVILRADASGAVDATAALQSLINVQAGSFASGKPITLPAGKFRITSTITFPKPSGAGRLVGGGNYVGNVYSGSRKGTQTVLIWDGPAGGTMFEQDQGIGWRFEGIVFQGRATASAPTRAGAFVKLIKSTLSHGGGTTNFIECSFIDVDTAVQVSGVEGQIVSDVRFKECYWEKVDDCLLSLDVQGVNYRFDSPIVYLCKRFYHPVRGGGNTVINLLQTTSSGGQDADSWLFKVDSMAQDSGDIIVNGWRCEQGTKQLVKMSHIGRMQVNGLVETQANQNSQMFDIRGATLILRGGRLLTSNAVTRPFSVQNGGGGQRGQIICEEVQFDVPAFTLAEWFAWPSIGHDTRLSLFRCGYGANNLPLPNRNTDIDYGPVTHRIQTTDASQRSCTFDGNTSSNVYNTCTIADGTTWLIDAIAVGTLADGTQYGAFHRRCLVQNVAGALTIVGPTQTVGTDYNVGAWGGLDFNVNNTFQCIRAAVTGKTATTVNWSVELEGRRVRNAGG